MAAEQLPPEQKQSAATGLTPVLQIGKFRLEGRPADVVLLLSVVWFLGWLIYKLPRLNNWPPWLAAA